MTRLARCLAAVLLVSGACTQAPVEWSDEAVSAPPTESAADSVALPMTAPAVACSGSMRVARAGGTTYAVWWSPRADSTATLVSAHTRDGGRSWSPVAPVDTADRGPAGCRRAPASIAADSASGYVHVAYGMKAAEGPGIFFAHSMDRGMTFHAPVPILYGDRPGHTSVAADGDRVVVAFEDPNGAAPRIGIALSKTMGHIFEDRVVPVSTDHGAASEPRVTLSGRTLRVSWRQQSGPGTPVVVRTRSGRLQ